MDFKQMILGREATEDEVLALQKANDILNEAGLELVGGRPKGR